MSPKPKYPSTVPPVHLRFCPENPATAQLLVMFFYTPTLTCKFVLLDRACSLQAEQAIGIDLGGSYPPPSSPDGPDSSPPPLTYSLSQLMVATGYGRFSWKSVARVFMASSAAWTVIDSDPQLTAFVDGFCKPLPLPVATQTSRAVVIEYELDDFRVELATADLSSLGSGASGAYGRVIKVALGAMGKVGKPGCGAVKFFYGLEPRSVLPKEVLAARAAVAHTLAVGLGLKHAHLMAIRGLVRDTEGEVVGVVYDHMPGTLQAWATAEHAVGEHTLMAKSLAVKCSVMADIACALRYMHRHGVIHRDLKPANILVDADGRGYLNDFDLATWSRTSSGKAGTVGYVGQEGDGSVRNTQQLHDYMFDVFSVGATLIYILAGGHADDRAMALGQDLNRGKKLAEIALALHFGSVLDAPELERKRVKGMVELALDCARWIPAERLSAVRGEASRGAVIAVRAGRVQKGWPPDAAAELAASKRAMEPFALSPMSFVESELQKLALM